jgi:hypothetical protein
MREVNRGRPSFPAVRQTHERGSRALMSRRSFSESSLGLAVGAGSLRVQRVIGAHVQDCTGIAGGGS